jgi:hypothetical protein
MGKRRGERRRGEEKRGEEFKRKGINGSSSNRITAINNTVKQDHCSRYLLLPPRSPLLHLRSDDSENGSGFLQALEYLLHLVTPVVTKLLGCIALTPLPLPVTQHSGFVPTVPVRPGCTVYVLLRTSDGRLCSYFAFSDHH